MALHTGTRKGEILGLCWDRVDFKKNLLTVSRTMDRFGLKDTTKTHKKRFVPIFGELRKILERLFKEQRHSEFVFTKKCGQLFDYNHVYRDFRKCQDLANITKKIKFHDLRHVFASQFMENGGSLFALQKILGHTDPKMTSQRYAHFSLSHMQDTLEFMDLGVSYEAPP